MNSAQIVRFEPLRSLAFGSISGTYTAIGTPFVHASRVIVIDNTTDADLLISFDGIHDQVLSIAHSGKILDFCSNRTEPVGILEVPVNTTVYVKQAVGAPTLGTVYITVMYASTT
jgi:hypothetical protein